MELDLNTIDSLMKLMITNKIDQLKLGDLLLTKTKHDAPKAEANSSAFNGDGIFSDEELLYFSSTGPSSLTPEQVAALAVNPAPIKSKRAK